MILKMYIYIVYNKYDNVLDGSSGHYDLFICDILR